MVGVATKKSLMTNVGRKDFILPNSSRISTWFGNSFLARDAMLVIKKILRHEVGPPDP